MRADAVACHVPQKLQRMLYNNKSYGLFNSWTSTEKQWYDLRQAAIQQLREEKHQWEGKGGTLLVLNVAEYVGLVGEMSYPNYIHGPERSLRKPDVHLLASLCEEAGIDLRILVLNRQANQIYHSTITNRKFSRAIKQ